MRKILLAVMPGLLLFPAMAQAMPGPSISYANPDAVRVVALPTSFGVFWRENNTRVRYAELDHTTGVQPKQDPFCVLGAVPTNSPNEVGYDVVPRGAEFSIVFSGAGLGKVHRGSAGKGGRCEGTPDPAFDGPAPGVRLSQLANDARAMAFFGTTANGFVTYVDIEAADGTHTTIPTRHDSSPLSITANPSFVGGKTALFLVPTRAALLAQTFDTTLAVAIDAEPKRLVEGIVERAIAYPEGADGGFRILYSTGGALFEGHLREGVFTKTPITGSLPPVDLVDATLDLGTGENAQVVVVEERTSHRIVLMRPRTVEGKTQPFGPQDSAVEFAGGSGTPTDLSVGCLDKVCLVAMASSQNVLVGLISGNKLTNVGPLSTTVTQNGGGSGRPTEVIQGNNSDATGSSGCSIHTSRDRDAGFGVCMVSLGLCTLRRLGRRRQARPSPSS